MGLPHTERALWQGALGQGFPRCSTQSDWKPGCLSGRRVDKHPGANTSLHPLSHPAGQRKWEAFPN